MMRGLILMSGSIFVLAGCAASQTENAADLNAAFNVAAAAEAVYAANPGANKQAITQMSELLAAAQAALVSWSNAPSPSSQSAVNAAIAALIAYEAAAKAS